MDKVEPAERINQSRKKLMINNFLGGLAWALGVTIGFSILIGILTLIASYIDFVPIVGDFVSAVLDYILSQNNRIP